MFVVVFVGIIDLRWMQLTYASAGHSGAYLRRENSVRQLRVTGPVVGLERSSAYQSAVVELHPADLLVLATDGMNESRNAAGVLLDDEGAMRLIGQGPRDPQAHADYLVATVKSYSGGRVDDDLALLAIRVDGFSPSPTSPEKGRAG